MTTLVIPLPKQPLRSAGTDSMIRISVNVHAEILDADVARRRANGWLLENAGNLLGAENPELLLGDRLLWRYDVMLGLPNLEQEGAATKLLVGRILVDAATGIVETHESLVEELRAHAQAATR